MDVGLRARPCLVTGSTTGIGLETARMLAVEGGRVIVTGRDRERVERAKEEAGATAGIAADLATPEAAERLVAEAGQVDCLVNNVGGAYQATFDQLNGAPVGLELQLKIIRYVRCIIDVHYRHRPGGR